jgi:predicted component of type VI protein secretion system
MMPKIVWWDRERIMEAAIPARGFMTLGRSRENHIILTDPRVHDHHARLVCGPHGCLLKDMTSANGLQVNGDPVRTRFLLDGDLIRIGHHVLEYRAAPWKPADAPSSPLMAGRPALQAGPGAIRRNRLEGKRRVFLRYRNGPAKGHLQAIDRPLTPIGDPNGYYAAVSSRTSGYYLLNLGKGFYVRLNGELVRGAGTLLQDRDVISLGDEEVEVRVLEEIQH